MLIGAAACGFVLVEDASYPRCRLSKDSLPSARQPSALTEEPVDSNPVSAERVFGLSSRRRPQIAVGELSLR